ncbi:1-aminocyclopropane-1-carboxylate deaminase/D-cysteine desulfhydrase [Sinomicrobium weinanense]|uniref:1-aminocyclopropane-1-carboxylate deaminase/D-cysteine desulfhydrase n=1 Tax=Sinomicrobium weinanense TaxID=2842200 RepID=A0A926JUW4_9FLAO|nr:pyridoxal-phosphate dependent enzyme [Sinomicrobium weinanense]MBC9797915.1 1-aminocyclopropane-1-carboxylate deaminase/D-cysteine desulfhydrase [Sinomicrobium weinanense]MBU3123198.1 pyridoxal-phosphate dependent enzyme [Sinomicrobium weinanense]
MLREQGITLHVKREDLLHPHISGNKYRKLRYNLEEAKDKRHNTLLTFGGAYSNHIAAVAAAGKEYGFRTIGIIRGEELSGKVTENPTLRFAEKQGMQFRFISRQDFRGKNSPEITARLQAEFGSFFLLPEGGTNALAVKGCEEILGPDDAAFDYICCPVGTGGTIAGLINSAKDCQQVLGFPALNGDFLTNDIRKFAKKDNWALQNGFHFGGYAKVNTELVHFINDFKQKTGIPLDPVYTGKMIYGILKLIKDGYFKNGSKILAIHTGGLQGIPGMNTVLKKKGLPLIR